MKKVTKAVIPAAGFGTRLLPATKAVAKEMLPIINIPTIQHIVQEAVDSGIKDILIVLSAGKESIMQHFGHNKALEQNLLAKKKMKMYDEVIKLSKLANITYVYQNEMMGLGDAIGYAKKFAKNEPFAVLLGDDVVVNKGKTALRQCIDAYEKTGTCIVGVQPVADKVVHKYGIVAPIKKADAKKPVFALKDLVEKPELKDAPSNMAILGRYVLTPDIFKAIEKTKTDKSGEVQITNALRILVENKKGLNACVFKGTRYDLGSRLGIVKAVIDFALVDDEIGKDVKAFIKGKK